MTFQIHALDPGPFRPLADLATSDIGPHRAVWVEVDSRPGYPCRVSLEDAAIGTRLLLVNFDHLPVESPYRSSHAIYIDPTAKQAHPAPDTVPPSIASRLISWRAFDDQHMMVDADVVEGKLLKKVLGEVFSQDKVTYIHLHNARPGCYAARVTRS